MQNSRRVSSLFKFVLVAFIASAWCGRGFAATDVTFTNGGGDNLWETPENWDPAAPGATDRVTIPDTFQVVLATEVTVAKATIQGGLIIQAGGILTTAEASLSNSVTFQDGTAEIRITDSMDWINGTISGSQGKLAIQAGADLFISGDGVEKILNAAVIENSGQVSWSGDDLTLGSAAQFFNQDGATFLIQANANIIGTGADSTFTNAGTLKKLAGLVGDQIFDCHFDNTGNGTVELQNGTSLTLNNGSTVGSNGVYQLGTNATLTFGGLNTHTLRQGAEFLGTGKAVVVATVNVQGDVQINSGVTLNVDTDGNLGGAGTLNVDGTLDLSAGQLAGTTTVSSQGTLRFTTPGNKSITGSLTHAGAATWVAGDIYVQGSSGVFTTADTGTLTIDSAAQLAFGENGFAVNNGTWRKTVTGVTATVISAPFDNNGTFEVQADVSLEGGSSTGSTGTFTLSNNAKLQMQGTHTLNGASFDGAGLVKLFTGTLNIDGDSTLGAATTIDIDITSSITGLANFDISGTLLFTTGTISGTVNILSGGALTFVGDDDKIIDGGILKLGGTGTWDDTGAGDLVGSNTGAFQVTATGVFNISCDSTMTFDVGSGITNAGTWNKTAGTFVSTVIDGAFVNSGKINVQSGEIEFSNFQQSDPGYTFVAAGATLTGDQLNIVGGTLAGAGTVDASVTNGGIVSPDPSATPNSGAATLTITGDYTQSTTGRLNVQASAEDNRDLLDVGGFATLDGAIGISPVTVVPPEQDQIVVLTSVSARQGQFVGIFNSGGTSLKPQFNPNDVTLLHNGRPVANADVLVVVEDTPTAGTLGGSDPDNDIPLLFGLDTAPTHGTVEIQLGGGYIYTPAQDYSGPDSFKFVVNDGFSDSIAATVAITVTTVNDSPTATDVNLAAGGFTPANGTLTATDPDSATLTYSIVAQPNRGAVVLNDAATGAFTYTSGVNLTGSDTFTFKANDGNSDSNIATVHITITAENRPPTFPSAPTATPNPGFVGGAVTFTAVPSDLDNNDTVTVTWDFKDGSPTATGSTVTHTYTTAGTYVVEVSATDTKATVNATINLTITNPLTAVVTKGAVKFSFTAPLKDSFALSGTMPIPDGTVLAGKTVNISIGGFTANGLVLSSKLVAAQGKTLSFKITAKLKKGTTQIDTAKGPPKYALAIKSSTLFPLLQVFGFVNADVKGMSVPTTSLFDIGGQVFKADKTFIYSAKAGKSGSGK